jgi:hypothetical protein
MSRGHDLAMPVHQFLTALPTRFKHCRMHRPSLHALALGPYPLGMNALQRFIGTQQETGQVTTHLRKADSAAKYGTIWLQVRLPRLRNAN